MRRLVRRSRVQVDESADRLPVGAWIEHRSLLDALDRRQRLGLAAQFAAFQLNPQRAETNGQRSLLRVDATGAGAVRIGLGKIGLAQFQPEWAVELHDIPGDGMCVLTIARPDGRRRGGDDRGNDAMVAELRSRLGELLADGPPVALTPGAPDTRALMRVATLGVSPLAKARSPFDADFILPPDPSFRPGQILLFPGVRSDELRQLIAQLHIPVVGSSDELGLLIDLSAGRRDRLGLRLINTPDGAGLQIDYVEESLAPLTIHRAHRAAATVLAGLVSLDGPMGRVGRRAAVALESWTSAQRRSSRHAELIPTWTVRTSIDTVPLPLPGDFPVAVMCTTRDVDLAPTLADAERWLAVRQCDWPSGPGGIDASSPGCHVTRRPVTPSRPRTSACATLRYGHAESNDLLAVPTTDRADWFWSVTLDATSLPDGRRRSTLVVDGMSSSHGVLSYAAELLVLFDAFISLVRHRYPEVEVGTLLLTHDGDHGVRPAPGQDLQPRNAPSTSSASSGRQIRRSGSQGSGSL